MSQKQIAPERLAEGTLHQILKQLKAVVAHDSSAILLLTDGQLQPVAVRGHSPLRQIMDLRFPLDDSPALRHLVTKGEPLIFTGQSEENPFCRTLCWGLECSCINVPLLVGEKPIGLLSVNKRGLPSYGMEEAQVVFAFARQAALAIEKDQLYAEARRLALYLKTAAEVGKRVTALLDLDSLLAQVVDLIRENFGYYQVNILLVDDEKGQIFLREASGPAARLIKARGLRLKIGQEGITGWVARTGEPVLCNDVSREPRYYAEELLPETQSELAVPLRLGQRGVVGVLDIQSDRLDAFYEEDVTALQLLGDQVAIALENARLFQETKRRFEAMRALHDISLDITTRLESQRVLAAILEQAAHLLSAQGSTLAIYDLEADLVRKIAIHNVPPEYQGVVLRLGEGAVGRVVATGKPLIVNDYRHWTGCSPLFQNSPYDAILSVPLRWEGQVFGALSVLDHGERRPFTEDDVQLLSLFADLASIALKNAELHTQVREFSQELEREVEERTRELARAKEEIATKAEQLRLLLAKTIHIQEEERARIARDMHDGVMQLVTAARYELQAAKVAVGSGLAAAAQEKLNAAREVLNEMEKEIRHAIYDLQPPILDAVGLAPALRKYANSFQELSGIACRVQVMGMPLRLSPPTEVAVFRIVEEALHNVAAHAGARTASIILDFQPTVLGVTVEDDGQGFDYQQWAESRDGKHLGLLGMQERVKSLGGELVVWSKPGQGTRVMFWLPGQRDGG